MLLTVATIFGQTQDNSVVNFTDLRSLQVPKIKVVDSAETATNVLLNNDVILSNKWMPGWHSGHKVHGRLEYAECGDYQFLLAGGEIYFNTIFIISHGKVCLKANVKICNLKTAKLSDIAGKKYLELLYNDKFTDLQIDVPDELILIYLPEFYH